MQRVHIRYCSEQISTPSSEECGAQIEDAEASWCDKGFGYDRGIYYPTGRLCEPLLVGFLKLTFCQNETNLYIVTERVVPLEWHVKRRSLSEETAKWGLYTISVRITMVCSSRIVDAY